MGKCGKCGGRLIGQEKDEEPKEEWKKELEKELEAGGWIRAQCENCNEGYYMKKCWLCGPAAAVENWGGISNLYVTGDEKMFDIYYCELCQNYFLRVYIDVWLAETTEEIYNVYIISPKMARECVERILTCPRPNSKHCRCEQHKFFEEFEAFLAKQKKLLIYVGGSRKAHSGITPAEVAQAAKKFFEEHPEK